MTRSVAVLTMFVLSGIAACSGAGSSGFGKDAGGGAGSGGTGGTGGTTGSGGSGGSGGTGGIMLTGDGGDAAGGCTYMDSTDHDGDGWSYTSGDCNDCDPTINPGAYDIPMDMIDEDCNGTPDDEPTACDTGLAIDSTDAMDGAKAMDLCRQTTEAAVGKGRTWGVVLASYVLPDGATSASANYPLGHGLLSAFGVNNTQQGVAMLGISSGSARQPTDPGYKSVGGFDKLYTSGAPAGYPKATPACPSAPPPGKPHDGAALQLTIRVPTNAKTLSFDQNFFTYEYPGYICSTYNDTYVVMMAPKTTPPSITDDNIAYDSDGNPISVNNGLLQVCAPGTHGGKSFACPLGTTALTSTGFEGHASTGWLTTTAPVDTLSGKDITLLFAIWDSSDGVLDSTTLIDNFTWGFKPPTGVTTTPTPMPK